MKNQEEIQALVRESAFGELAKFRPCAFFDERLDCIRVIARDCSVLEERITGRVTVLIDSYYPGPGRKQYVGFTIKGAKHFCQEQGWDSAKSIKMTTLLDAILATFPDLVVEWFVEKVAKPLVEEERIDQVEIRGSELQPA